MPKSTGLKLSKYSVYLIIITLMIGSYAFEASAQTAGDVLDKMSSEQSASYINGVVEGLAYARWLKDKPDQTGMRCIYNWNYGENSEANTQRLLAWFQQQQDKPVGALVHVMIKKDCGE